MSSEAVCINQSLRYRTRAVIFYRRGNPKGLFQPNRKKRNHYSVSSNAIRNRLILEQRKGIEAIGLLSSKYPK